jgi:hypothetical protein
MNRELLRRALAALEESLDAVETEFDEDWRHGIPTREKQLDRMKWMIVEHIAVINDIRAEIEKPEPVEYQRLTVDGRRHKFNAVTSALADGKYRLLAEKIQDD